MGSSEKGGWESSDDDVSNEIVNRIYECYLCVSSCAIQDFGGSACDGVGSFDLPFYLVEGNVIIPSLLLVVFLRRVKYSILRP